MGTSAFHTSPYLLPPRPAGFSSSSNDVSEDGQPSGEARENMSSTSSLVPTWPGQAQRETKKWQMPSAWVWGGSRGWEGALCRLQTPQQIFPRLLAECSSSCPSCLPGPPASTQKKAHLARGLRSNLGLLTIHTAPHHTLSSCPPTGSSSLNGVCLSQLPRVGSALLFLQLGHCLLSRVLEGSIPAPRSGLRPPQSWGATYTIQPCLPSLIFYKIPTADKPAFLCYHLILSLSSERGGGQG